MRANKWANKSGHMGAAYNILRKSCGRFTHFYLVARFTAVFDPDQGLYLLHVYTIRIADVAVWK
jgi:hypothetical protein